MKEVVASPGGGGIFGQEGCEVRTAGAVRGGVGLDYSGGVIRERACTASPFPPRGGALPLQAAVGNFRFDAVKCLARSSRRPSRGSVPVEGAGLIMAVDSVEVNIAAASSLSCRFQTHTPCTFIRYGFTLVSVCLSARPPARSLHHIHGPDPSRSR